jgi:hypothetical protein
MQEANVMASLRHPNVLTFLAICKSPPCLVSEYCVRGSLFELLREARGSPALQKQLHWHRRLKMVSLGGPLHKFPAWWSPFTCHAMIVAGAADQCPLLLTSTGL